MYSFISDNISSPSVRVVYRHYGTDVALVAVYAYDVDKGGNAFASTNPDILPVLSVGIIDSIKQEIQEYLVEEFGENEE